MRFNPTPAVAQWQVLFRTKLPESWTTWGLQTQARWVECLVPRPDGQNKEAPPALLLAVSTGAMLHRADLACEQKSLFLKWERTGYTEGFAAGVHSGHTMGHVTSLHFLLLRVSQKPRVVRTDGHW